MTRSTEQFYALISSVYREPARNGTHSYIMQHASWMVDVRRLRCCKMKPQAYKRSTREALQAKYCRGNKDADVLAELEFLLLKVGGLEEVRGRGARSIGLGKV